MSARLAQTGRGIFLAAALVLGFGAPAQAQTGPDTPSSTQAAQEKNACIANLKTIYAAIQAYQADHKDLPNWLSDLVPDYLKDENVLVCPVCRRTGKIEAPPLADPKIPSSYLFEFCPVPLGKAAPQHSDRTRREWKRRQMGIAGAMVPLVRCRHHEPMLNVAFDGKIYESGPAWEELLTNRCNPEQLKPERIFGGNDSGGKPASPVPPPRSFPKRDPDAQPQQLDLSAFYNETLTEPWKDSSSAASLPKGLQSLAGITFDLRGVIRLANKRQDLTYPREARNLPVHLKCRRLHFLHAAATGKPTDEGKQIGLYIVHYATNQMRLEIPIFYGREVRSCRTVADEGAAPSELRLVWTGRGGSHVPRLFLTTWQNLVPDIEIDRIDFISTFKGPAPFLVAITAE